MKLLILVAVCVATVVHGGRIHFRRPNTELVDLFSELGTDLASKLADKLETIDLDLTEPITEENPEKTWRAVETVLTTVVEEVIPTDCEEAVAVHAITAFVSHLVKEVVIKDLLHATEEIDERTDVNSLKPWKSEEIPTRSWGIKPRAMSRMNKWKTAFSKDSSEEMDWSMEGKADVEKEIEEVMTVIARELKEKMERIQSAIGGTHMGRLFKEMQSRIEADILVNKPTGEVIKKVAYTIHKYMVPFKTGEVSCDVAESWDQIEDELRDVIEFLDDGFERCLERMRLPRHMKEILKDELKESLPKVAEILKKMLKTVRKEEFVSFFVSLFKEIADDFFRGVEVSRKVKEIASEGRLMSFVETLVSEHKTEEIAELMLKTTAMTLTDLEVAPKEIDSILTGIVEMLVKGKLPEETRSYDKFTELFG